MAFEMKDNTGSLFKNDRKQSDTHADYGGTVMIDGREYWINAWLNKSGNGQTYMGLKFKPKGERKQDNSQPASSYDEPRYDRGSSHDPNDDLPF